MDAPRDMSVVHAVACRVWRVARPDLTTFVVRISPPGRREGRSTAHYPTTRLCMGVRPERLVDWHGLAIPAANERDVPQTVHRAQRVSRGRRWGPLTTSHAASATTARRGAGVRTPPCSPGGTQPGSRTERAAVYPRCRAFPQRDGRISRASLPGVDNLPDNARRPARVEVSFIRQRKMYWKPLSRPPCARAMRCARWTSQTPGGSNPSTSLDHAPSTRGGDVDRRWLTPSVPGRVDFGPSPRGPPGRRANGGANPRVGPVVGRQACPSATGAIPPRTTA